MSFECECKFNEVKCNSYQWWNNDKYWFECKKSHVYEKDYVWNSATCSCENGKYFANIVDDSVIMCDEIIESYHEETKTIPTNFNERKATCKVQNFNILLGFLLITVTLLIAVNIYCNLIKYLAKQEHFTSQILR